MKNSRGEESPRPESESVPSGEEYGVCAEAMEVARWLPPSWRRDGDECEVSIEGIGSLFNFVQDERL